jgi:hypothetical protein
MQCTHLRIKGDRRGSGDEGLRQILLVEEVLLGPFFFYHPLTNVSLVEKPFVVPVGNPL